MAKATPYDDLIMDHIKNARNYRALDPADRQSHGANPLCGDEVTVYLRMGRGERIDDIAYQCTCCGISMASASLMTESVKGGDAGRVRSQIRAIVDLINSAPGAAAGENDMQRALLATVQEFPARKRCAALPWITLEAALADRPEAIFVP